jgi:hypothetical protein
MRWRPGAATWILLGSLAACAAVAWFIAALLARDMRKSMRIDVGRIVREAATDA